MTNAFATAFAAYAPILRNDFVVYHSGVVARLITEFDGRLRGLGNHGGYWGGLYRNSREFIRYDGNRMDSLAVGVNQDWLTKQAEVYAELTIADFVAKLTKKLESLTDVEVLWANGDKFTITGKLGDRKVTVHQDRVFKVSPKGTPFHQWPARIYVDGKFTPEVSFKKLAA